MIIVIAVVAVIIIMNTLVISVTERISEIGTMRAIGARKGFVRRMIGAETVTLAFVFGGAGVVLALLLLLILGATGIRASNLFLRILFGGEVLRPVISLGSVAFSLLMVAAIGVLSSLYPLAVALRISTAAGDGHRLMLSQLRIAFRNTGRQKKRTVLLAGAIAFGVLVVTLLNGFTGGVSRNIERALTDLIGGHVYVSGTELTESRLIIDVIRDAEGRRLPAHGRGRRRGGADRRGEPPQPHPGNPDLRLQTDQSIHRGRGLAR